MNRSKGEQTSRSPPQELAAVAPLRRQARDSSLHVTQCFMRCPCDPCDRAPFSIRGFRYRASARMLTASPPHGQPPRTVPACMTRCCRSPHDLGSSTINYRGPRPPSCISHDSARPQLPLPAWARRDEDRAGDRQRASATFCGCRPTRPESVSPAASGCGAADIAPGGGRSAGGEHPRRETAPGCHARVGRDRISARLRADADLPAIPDRVMACSGHGCAPAAVHTMSRASRATPDSNLTTCVRPDTTSPRAQNISPRRRNDTSRIPGGVGQCRTRARVPSSTRLFGNTPPARATIRRSLAAIDRLASRVATLRRSEGR